MSRESDLLGMARLVATTTPGYVRMRGHPELHSWAAQLVEFGRSEHLQPLAPALEFVATSPSSPLAARERSHRPLQEALRSFGATIPPGSIQWASAVALERASERPYACFALAWVRCSSGSRWRSCAARSCTAKVRPGPAGRIRAGETFPRRPSPRR